MLKLVAASGGGFVASGRRPKAGVSKSSIKVELWLSQPRTAEATAQPPVPPTDALSGASASVRSTCEAQEMQPRKLRQKMQVSWASATLLLGLESFLTLAEGGSCASGLLGTPGTSLPSSLYRGE